MPTPYDRFLPRAVGLVLLTELLLSLYGLVIMTKPWNTVHDARSAGAAVVWMVFLLFLITVYSLPVITVTALVIARRLDQVRAALPQRAVIEIGLNTAMQGILLMLCLSICSSPGRSQLWNLQMISFMLVLPGLMYAIHIGRLHVRPVFIGVLVLNAVAAVAEFGTSASAWSSYFLNVVMPGLFYVISSCWLATYLQHRRAMESASGGIPC